MTDTWTGPDDIERYKKSQIVAWLGNQIDLNDMWEAYREGAFPKHEFMQFYRDIGFSVVCFDEVWGYEEKEEENTLEVTKDMAEEKTERTFSILCPWHRVEETITLPSSYDVFFKGLVPCGHDTEVERKTVFLAVEGKMISRLGLNTVQ